uniref:HTH_Tnp_Tc3_1 domain-containing protein n=1 Tax=Rhabditophanes sp. KR3021 TaxID=114890 RepID=A0AC35TS96_9BILA
MGGGKKLTLSEQKKISNMSGKGQTILQIAIYIGRSRHVVYNYLKNSDVYGTSKHTGRKRKLNERDIRAIGRASSNRQVSCARIKNELGLQNSLLEKKKNESQTGINKKPKKVRYDFACKVIKSKLDWSKVIFTDEKRFNLDGWNQYWHDIRKPEIVRKKRCIKGGSVMIWTALRVCIKLQAIPPYSPDLNLMENVYSMLTRSVYEGGRQYQSFNALKKSIQAAWEQIDSKYLSQLVNSMRN